MTWRTHALGGIASLWLLAPVLTAPDLIAVTSVCAAIGALLPDLDAPGCKANTLAVGGLAPLSIVGAFASLGKHRGFLHSLAGACIVCLPTAVGLSLYLGWQAGAALLLGYLSHLLLDCATVSGLRLLWPSRQTFWLLPRPLRIITGSAEEGGLLLLLGFLCAGMLLQHLNGLF